MFRLGLRMALGGGREAYVRLAAIAGGVMIGVALLLFAIAGLNVLHGASQKSCWQCTVMQFHEDGAEDLSRKDVLLWRHDADYYQGKTIARHDIAVQGKAPGVIPGTPRLPAAGEYYASPALARLIAAAPRSELGDRFPGRLIGEIGRVGLSSPDELVVIVGHDSRELATVRDVRSVSRINLAPQSRDPGPLVTALFVMAVGGLLFAVMTLIATSTRLAAARREEKFAALRLAGATPTQVGRFAAIDAVLSATLGTVAGFGLFYVLRATLAGAVSTDFIAFFTEDLTPGGLGTLVVLVGTPLAAAAAAVFALRRVRVSPLGVSRHVTPKPPRAWRVAPLLVGVAVIAVTYLRNLHVTDPDARADALPLFLLGFALLMVGLVVAGPWLTLVVTRLFARSARSASTLLASRRLADNPSGAFRSVGVMVVVLFIATVIACMAPLLLRGLGGHREGADKLFIASQYLGRNGKFTSTEQAGQLIATLNAVPGVRVMPTYVQPTESQETGITQVVVDCADLALLQVFRQCDAGVRTALMEVGFEFNYVVNDITQPTPKAFAMSPTAIKTLPMYNLVVLTDGQPHHIERLRTVLAQNPAYFSPGMTWGEESAGRAAMLHSVELIINGFLFIVLFVAGCSLAIAAGGGIIERKRPFTLLRVAGMSQPQLSRVVLYESVVPLLATAALAVAAAVFVSRMLVGALLDKGTKLAQPGPGYYVVVFAGLGVGLLILLAILPLLEKVTRPANFRSE